MNGQGKTALVIGAGLGGLGAAVRLREADWRGSRVSIAS